MLLGDVCSRELTYLAITSSVQISQHVFGGLSSSQARGLGGLLLTASSLAPLAPQLGGWAPITTRCGSYDSPGS
jgi:hypothetical protein